MEKAKITDALVKAAALPEGKGDAIIWDTEITGFGLRLRERSKSFIVSYRPAGAGRSAATKRIKLGSPETIGSVKEARRLARVALGAVASGRDPAAERREQRRREKSAVRDALARYDAVLESRGYVNRATVRSVLRRNLKPFMSRDVAEITGRDLADIVERIDRSGRAGAASDFRSRCSAFLTWCAFEAKLIPANPLAGYRRRRATRVEALAKQDRTRALSDVELAAVWRAADSETAFGRLVRFLILTGCRRSEGAGLRREMIDLAAGRIDLPAVFTKQARGHTVFVSAPLATLLDGCPIDARDPGLVFPSPRKGEQIKGWTRLMDPRATRREGNRPRSKSPYRPGLVVASGVDFTLHDLRRTFRTGLARLGFDREIAELALGHAREDLEARYNRHDCARELRAAFEAWGRHVAALVADDREGRIAA